MPNPVTILQVRSSYTYGGVETTMLGWLDNIDQSRFDCPVALFKNRGGMESSFRESLEKRKHTIYDLPWAPNRNIFGAISSLTEIIRRTKAQALHTHDWRSDVVGYYAAKRAGIPIMTTIYVWFNRPMKIYVSELIDAWFIRRFHRVTAVCQATLKQCIERGVKPDRGSVLISGIRKERYAEHVDREKVRERFRIATNDTALVYVARLSPEKAHRYLIDSFSQVVKHDQSTKLLLLGTGPSERELRKQVSNMGLSERIIMPGFVTDIPVVLRAMDVMVHPSLAEGIPLAVYEGMLAGLAVIGTNVDGTPEVVRPGKTGWLVQAKDVDSLANTILEASRNPEQCRIYGAAARELILNNYSMDTAIRDLHCLYESLVGRRYG